MVNVSGPAKSGAKGVAVEEASAANIEAPLVKAAANSEAEAEAVVDAVASATKTAKTRMGLPLSASASKHAVDVAEANTEVGAAVKIVAEVTGLPEEAVMTIVQRKMPRLTLRRTKVTN